MQREKQELPLKGVTDLAFSPIRKLLSLHLHQLSVELVYSKSLTEIESEPCSFYLVDGHKYLATQESERQMLRKGIASGIAAYALLMRKDYRAKLSLLSEAFQDCFEFPIMTEILSRTIKNQLTLRNILQNDAKRLSLHDSTNIYSPDVPILGSLPFEFLAGKNQHWYLRHRQIAQYISPIEKRVLEYLARSNRIVPKRELAFVGWHTFDVKDNTIIATMKRLRALFTAIEIPFKIRNLYGYGYSLTSLTST